MNTQEKLDQISDQVDTLSRKYADQSISPSQDSNRRNLRRIKSGGQSLKQFKPQQQNFLKQSKETQGGGFYKRSQIMGTSFPSIRTKDRPNNNTNDINKTTTKKEESITLAQIDSIIGIKTLLGPNHHCHFEIQVKQLKQKLEISEQLNQRVRDELESVIWMVKNYNSEGLISKLLTLQQLKNELEKDQQLMRNEIEMLGLQRDDWQQKYQDIYEKLLKMQGIENDLHDALHKLQMSNESLEQVNRRLREKQLEVQDWQRKCNTHDEQFKIRINNLEDTLKDKETQIQQLQRKLQKFDSDNAILIQEMKIKAEKLEEEQRRAKQLHAELLDTRVNKVQNLQDEITKQKKVIQQRVEEIEEQEKKNKTLNNKLNLLETQLKNFDDVARQEKEELEKGWQKKYKELEKQSVQYKRDLNQLEIQLQQVDLLVQQKEHEVDVAVQKIKDLTELNEKQLETIRNNSLEIHKLTQEISEKEQDLEYAEQQNEEISKERTELIDRIGVLNNEISELKQQTLNMKKENEGLKWEKQDQDRKLEKLNDQINQANQDSERYRSQLDEEVKKTFTLYAEINKIKQDIEDLNQQHQNELNNKQKIINEKDEEINKLNERLQEFQNQDKDSSEKIQQLMKQNDDTIKQMQEIENNKKELQQQIQNLNDIIQQNEQKHNDLNKQINDLEDQNKQGKTLTLEIEKLKQELDQKSDYEQLKEKISQMGTIYDQKAQLEKELNDTKIELLKTQDELKEWKLKYTKQEIEKKNIEQQFIQFRDKSEQQQEIQLTQIQQLQKKNFQQNDELQKALDKIEILEEALSNQSKDIKIIPKQAQIPLQRNNTFQQIFVEDKTFSKDHQNEEIQLRFSEIDFSRSKGHLTICFWVKIDNTKSKEMLPILRISTENKKLLELGVYLDTKQVYSTFIPNNHPKNKKQQNPLSVTSQLQIKLGQFQLLALILNESGQYMDMGLCLNGVRDDQVSISTSLIFPEAQLTFGKYTNHHLILKDCLVITENLSRFNVFKEVYNNFYQKYNGIKQVSRRLMQKKENISYMSAGDLIFFLIQQHEQSPPKSGSRSKSPPNTQAVIINNRTIPAGLVNQYELANTKIKTDETKPEETIEQIQWNRKYGVEKLKKFLYSNFNYKGLLRPFIENYDYISMGLQLLEPSRNDENPPTKFHKIIKPKIQISPYYVMSYKQFIYYIQYVGLLRVTLEELYDICNLMEVIYQQDKEKYIHYDHFLIILRECIMNRADLKKKKEIEKGDPQPPQMIETFKHFYKEIIIQSTGKEEQEIELSNAIEINELIIDQNEQGLNLEIKQKNEQKQIYPLENLPQAIVGILNISQTKKIEFIFSNDSKIQKIKCEQGQLILNQQSEITIDHIIELEDNEKIVKFNINEKQIRLVLQRTLKYQEELPQPELDPETELETLTLPNIPDNWNLGKFYINIQRCKNCDKHESTTRHKEIDFTQKTEYISNILKEIFPNVEIIENEDKQERLEDFQVYIKNALGPSKTILLQKQESMPNFLQHFDKKLPNLFQKLMLIINYHSSTEKLGQEQEKFK